MAGECVLYGVELDQKTLVISYFNMSLSVLQNWKNIYAAVALHHLPRSASCTLRIFLTVSSPSRWSSHYQLVANVLIFIKHPDVMQIKNRVLNSLTALCSDHLTLWQLVRTQIFQSVW